MTIGQRCVLDHEKYIDVGSDGQQFANDILRHNCKAPQLYCDPSSLQCFRAKLTGEACILNLECLSVGFALLWPIFFVLTTSHSISQTAKTEFADKKWGYLRISQHGNIFYQSSLLQ
jgi:hypothetical protein